MLRIRWTQPDGKMSELKGNETTADEYDPARKPVQLHKFTAGYEKLRAFHGQLHGDCTGGQNDKAGGQLLMAYGNAIWVNESGAPSYKINAGFFQSVDRIVRHPRRKSVFCVTQLKPTGKCRGSDSNTGKMARPSNGRDAFVKPFFCLATP